VTRQQDRNRSAVYAAEDMVRDMVDRGADVRFHGGLLRPEPDRKFGQVADVTRYLGWLRAQPWAGSCEVPEPAVRVRKGAAKATWEPPGIIAIPDATWARREFVVLHEYAHHLVWHNGSGDTGHGPAFCRTLADLVRHAVGPDTGLLLTDAFYRAGLMSD
jgi:putative metallohydrolase (TIGR04338 family)